MKVRNELLVTECSYENVEVDKAIYEAVKMLRADVTDFENKVEFAYKRDSARILHGLLGMHTELGELLDAYKKHWYYHKPLDKANVAEEIGDIIWYFELLRDATNKYHVAPMLLGIKHLLRITGNDYDDCRDRVIKKLRVRYPEGFTAFDAEVRDTKAEMEAFLS